MNNNVSLEKIVAMHCTWRTMRFVFRKKNGVCVRSFSKQKQSTAKTTIRTCHYEYHHETDEVNDETSTLSSKYTAKFKSGFHKKMMHMII